MSITLQGNMINTSELSILLGSGLKRKFGKNMPCTLALSVKDTYPQLYKQEPDPLDKDIPNGAFYLSNQAKGDATLLNMQVQCQNANSEDPSVFEQVTTMEMELDLKFAFDISYSITVHLTLYDFDLKYTGTHSDDTVISLNKVKTNLILSGAVGVVKGTISTFFQKGHSFNNILDNTPLCWLDLSNIYFRPQYETYYSYFGITIGSDLDNCPEPEDMLSLLSDPGCDMLCQLLRNLQADLDEFFEQTECEDDVKWLIQLLMNPDQTVSAFWDDDEEPEEPEQAE